MMVAGGEKESGQGERKEKKKLYSRQLPEKEIVARQVKTCLHLPILSSYHSIYLSDFTTCKKQKEATVCEILIC